jgi:hypothetical protein
MAKITISYRRDDSMDITGRIFDRLASRYGRAGVFRDIDNIPPGLDFREHIGANLAGSDALIVVVGPRWTGAGRDGPARIHSETDYVRIEVETALGRNIPVIPLLVGGADMPQPSELPESIKNFAYRNAVKIDSGRDFDHHMNGLIRAMDGILLAPAKPPEPAEHDAAVAVASDPLAVSGTFAEQKGGPAPTQGSLVLPIVGGVMIALGLMHAGWFASNVAAAWASGGLGRMFLEVWTYADVIFGIGGLAIGTGTFFGRQWARTGGITLCLLITFSNLLWFIEYFDKGLPRLMLAGTGFTLLLAVVGVYVYAFHWPAAAAKSPP